MFKLREICNVTQGAFHLDITSMNSGEPPDDTSEIEEGSRPV